MEVCALEKITREYFDFPAERRGTDCFKYDYPMPEGARSDALQMWVADMDLRTAPEIIEALEKASAHGIFGYGYPDGSYDEAVCGWYKRRMGREILPEWITPTPGIVFAVSVAIRAVTEPGDSVLIQQPVYHPFAKQIAANGRTVCVNRLHYTGSSYTADYEDFEAQITENRVKAFVLCSPHNPVAKVWTRDELRRMCEICARHNVVIISDEIHSDFIYPGYAHTPTASLSGEIAALTVTCTAPSKTFNIAGLQGSNIIISNPELRKKYESAFAATGCGGLNCLSIAATKAAYTHGDAWLDALTDYLSGNVRILREGLEGTGIGLTEPQGTYLMWLDCRGLGLDDGALDRFFLNRAGIRMNAGAMFGEGGSGFMRMNIACPRAAVEEAVLRIRAALAEKENRS